MTSSDLYINDNDRVEVCEGSWLGRIGSVVMDQRTTEPGRVFVRFDDDNSEEGVVACTLAALDPTDDPKALQLESQAQEVESWEPDGADYYGQLG